jgi:hypothetical protein
MEKTEKVPLWVYLAFSSISKRRGALLLIWASVLFTLYCIPWAAYFDSPNWLVSLFVIDDWSWFAMMLPITLWYWLSLRWLDHNSGWIVEVVAEDI